MTRSLFLRIHDAVVEHDKYFVQKKNDAGQLGLSSLQKITAAMRMVAYGASADSVDDYVRIGKSTSFESVKRFVRSIINIFGEEYLRAPTNEDVARLLEEGSQRGFPGILGSIDCMHWTWKNCPTAWQGLTNTSSESVFNSIGIAGMELFGEESEFVVLLGCD
ncbi:uncharacterized protein LOC109835104 [Asparagus officinalis]|uniref:uncharacterized protein LOC109835104 n=1 Tax=Asparagus officinalis TaxID=4686 RepID=UPI00098E58B9|nr:uncharacterized protein LOC109835104 [Asparagus officinalis]